MPCGESQDGIFINIRISPELKIRKRMEKFTKSFVIMAYTNLAVILIIAMLMLFFKKEIETDILWKEDIGFIKIFFSLDDWKQWAVITIAILWALYAVALTLLLKKYVINESAKELKMWIIVDIFDCCCAGVILVLLTLTMTLVLGIIFGIFVLFSFIYEIYFLNTLLQFIKIITRTSNYDDDLVV